MNLADSRSARMLRLCSMKPPAQVTQDGAAHQPLCYTKADDCGESDSSSVEFSDSELGVLNEDWKKRYLGHQQPKRKILVEYSSSASGTSQMTSPAGKENKQTNLGMHREMSPRKMSRTSKIRPRRNLGMRTGLTIQTKPMNGGLISRPAYDFRAHESPSKRGAKEKQESINKNKASPLASCCLIEDATDSLGPLLQLHEKEQEQLLIGNDHASLKGNCMNEGGTSLTHPLPGLDKTDVSNNGNGSRPGKSWEKSSLQQMIGSSDKEQQIENLNVSPVIHSTPINKESEDGTKILVHQDRVTKRLNFEAVVSNKPIVFSKLAPVPKPAVAVPKQQSPNRKENENCADESFDAETSTTDNSLPELGEASNINKSSNRADNGLSGESSELSGDVGPKSVDNLKVNPKVDCSKSHQLSAYQRLRLQNLTENEANLSIIKQKHGVTVLNDLQNLSKTPEIKPSKTKPEPPERSTSSRKSSRAARSKIQNTLLGVL